MLCLFSPNRADGAQRSFTTQSQLASGFYGRPWIAGTNLPGIEQIVAAIAEEMKNCIWLEPGCAEEDGNLAVQAFAIGASQPPEVFAAFIRRNAAAFAGDTGAMSCLKLLRAKGERAPDNLAPVAEVVVGVGDEIDSAIRQRRVMNSTVILRSGWAQSNYSPSGGRPKWNCRRIC